MSDFTEWPGPLRAGLEISPLERKDWKWSIAPQMIGLFLWIAFFDQLPQVYRPGPAIGWSVIGAGIGGLLSYALLYRSTAMWGMSTRRPLAVVATGTFGIKGATWVPGLLLAMASILWLAVATSTATGLCLRGLVLMEFLEPSYLAGLTHAKTGPPRILFLATSLFWCYASALVGRYLVRVIWALMNVFPILPAFLMGIAVILAFKGIRNAQMEGAIPGPGAMIPESSPFSALLIVTQMVFGFFAMTGLSSVDWGVVARDSRDVRWGGWVGVVFASWIIASLAILTVAGAGAMPGAQAGLFRSGLTYQSAVEILVGGRLAGAMFLIFSIAALAPGCFAGFLFPLRLNEIWPRVRRTHWTIFGSCLAWLLVSAHLVDRLADVFTLVGGLTAPAVGAMNADYLRSRGTWRGGRRGYNLAGLIAWGVGSCVGVAPLLGPLLGMPRWGSMQPAAVFAWLAAFLVYLIAAGIGLEPALDHRLQSDLAAEPGEAVPS